jgi:hypothetical protein
MIGLDPEDMTKSQLRRALREAANMAVVHAMRKKPAQMKKESEEEEEECEGEECENDKLVNLHEEKKGDSKPPKVTADDLPKVVSNKVKKGQA